MDYNFTYVDFPHFHDKKDHEIKAEFYYISCHVMPGMMAARPRGPPARWLF